VGVSGSVGGVDFVVGIDPNGESVSFFRSFVLFVVFEFPSFEADSQITISVAYLVKSSE